MFSLFGNKKIRAFGLDVSDASVKVMQLRRSAGKIMPQAFNTLAFSSGLINNHLIVNQRKLADHIRRTVEGAQHIDTRYVVASVPEAKSFVRTVSLPRMDYSEIDSALPWELEQDIPVPIDQVYLDWQIISETPDKINLLVMASPKDYIEALVDTLKLADLKPVAFELESQATARALVGKEDLDQPVLILDMSTTQTSLIIVDHGNLMYTSSVPIAGNAFTESIARNLGVPPADAEKIKIKLGLTGESKQGNIRQAILPILDNIVDEIRNVIHFYEEHADHNSAISKIYLCGGSSKLLGLPDYVSARLNLGTGRTFGRVTLGNPWANVLAETPDQVPMDPSQALEYATAAGLALRGVNNEIN